MIHIRFLILGIRVVSPVVATGVVGLRLRWQETSVGTA